MLLLHLLVCFIFVKQLFWLLGLFNCCYYCLLLFLVLVCWLVLWYALVYVGFFNNLNIRFFADALMFGTGLFLLLSCWFLLCSLLVLFVGWSVFFFNFIDYCLFCLFYCLSSVLNCCCCIDWCVGVLVGSLVGALVFSNNYFDNCCFLFLVVFFCCTYLVFLCSWCIYL